MSVYHFLCVKMREVLLNWKNYNGRFEDFKIELLWSGLMEYDIIFVCADPLRCNKNFITKNSSYIICVSWKSIHKK